MNSHQQQHHQREQHQREPTSTTTPSTLARVNNNSIYNRIFNSIIDERHPQSLADPTGTLWPLPSTPTSHYVMSFLSLRYPLHCMPKGAV
jgi:hypothetical protein